MSKCINKSHPEFKELLLDTDINPFILAAKVGVWMDTNNSEDFPSIDQLNLKKSLDDSRVLAQLKIIDILPKLNRGVLKKGKEQGWINDLQKQGIPANQIAIFKKVAKPGMTKEDITIAIAGENSFSVETNIATNENSSGWYASEFKIGNDTYKSNLISNFSRTPEGLIPAKYSYSKNNKEISKEEFIEANESRITEEPTKYYSYLTVPGGTNYIETEISTPEITPGIKGHADFSTDKGIGWFRSDETTKQITKEEALNSEGNVDYSKAEVRALPDGSYGYFSKSDSKTRRILEFQSDLFQKGRDKEILTKSGGSSAENDFLQLLNKDGNWIKFFIKSIIQDSARKGYEKVLFPRGETAAKIEGQETIANQMKKTEELLSEAKQLELRPPKNPEKNNQWEMFDFSDKVIVVKSRYQPVDSSTSYRLEYESGNRYSEDYKYEGQSKEELQKIAKKVNKIGRVIRRGQETELREEIDTKIKFFENRIKQYKNENIEQLAPIENFYERRVTNVLKKQGYKIEKITDENGNTWNEVTIKKERDTAPILYQVGPSRGRAAIKQARDLFFKEVYQQELSENDIIRIDGKLRRMSDMIGDQPWRLRKSYQGNYYIAGYKNANVTAKEDTYYSPYANGMFRQMSSRNTEKANAKLDRILAAWARKHGVAVESLKSVMEKFPNRFEENALGVSDFMNSLIAIADGANIDTMAEEVAHFAIEMQLLSENETEYILGPPTVRKALEQVVDTATYAEVKEEYKDIYETEEDFRKEALGKILAAEIVNQFKQTDQLIKEEASGFWQSLKQVWQDFTAWLDWALGIDSAGRNDIEQVVIPLAQDILNLEQVGDYGKFQQYNKLKQYRGQGEFTKEDIKYQKQKKEDQKKINKKEEFLKDVQEQLLKKIVIIKRAQKETRSKSSKKARALLEAEKDKLELDLANKRYDLGIARWILNSKESVYEIFKTLDAAEKGEVMLSNTAIQNYKKFLDGYSSLINSLVEDVRVSTLNKEEGEIDDIEKAVSELRDLLAQARTRLKPLTKEKAQENIRRINRSPDGEVMDEEYDEDAAFDASQTSMWDWFKYQFGNYKNAKSPIIRAVHKLIYNAYNTVKRFSVRTARRVLNSQTLFFTKYKNEDLIEKKDDKITHYFESEYNRGDYFKNREEHRKEVAKALGFINEETGEGDPSLINKNFFTKEQSEIYSKMWEKWYTQNSETIKIPAKKDYIDDEGNLRTQVMVQKKNSNADPIWIEESDLENKKKQGYFVKNEYKQVPNQKYKNKDFAKKMQDEVFRLHYEEIMRVKREAIAKLPAAFRTDQLLYMVPSVMKSTLDRIFNADGNMFTRIKQVAQEGVMIEADDTQFGELRELDKDTVPIFFTKELKDPTKLSTDIGRSIVMFAEMAENFYQMTKISPQTNNILNSLEDKKYYKTKRGNIKEKVASEATMEYATVKEMIDSLVYGQQRETSETKIPGTNKTVSLTKITSNIARYIRNNNLAFNVPTSLAGYIKGNVDSIIEDSTGLYTTVESKNWARGEFLKEIATVVGQIGSTKQTSKMHLINQDMNIVTLDSMIYESDKSRLVRKAASGDLMYVSYATGDYGLKSRIALSVYDNYRLYDGTFITKENFLRKTAKKSGVDFGKSRSVDKAHEKSVQKEWESLREKSLYNAYEEVNGTLKIKKDFKPYINEGLLNAVRGKIEYVSNNVDGLLGETDKGKLARTYVGDFVLMHRGWFINLVDAKFQGEKTSWITGEEEIGHYTSFFGKYIPAIYRQFQDGKGLTAGWAAYDQLSKAQRRGVKKTALDLLATLIAAVLAGIAQKYADEDDDDEFVIHFTSLIMNRVLMEQKAPWSPTTMTDLVDEPIVGTKWLKSITDLGYLFNGEEVESGPYEGQTQRWKWVQKRIIPFGWKNIYELQYPEEKNKFYKQLVNKGAFSLVMLESDPEKQYSFTKWLKNNLLPSQARDWDTYQEQEKQDIYEQAIEELENEEEFNGWN